METIALKRLRPESLAFVLLLGSLGALPPLSIDMALPALGRIGATLHVDLGAATLTLSLFMAGFAIAQLLFGPLSDRYGRRSILLVGCAIYSVASLVCAVAPNIAVLLAARFVEGCGAGAGMVLVFAMVRDLFEGARARAQLSYVSLVLSVAPMIAPTLGAWILGFAHWRAIYALLGIGGAVQTAVIWFSLDDTLAAVDHHAVRLERLLTNYGRILRTRAGMTYTLINGLSFGCMFGYVAGSAPVMMHGFGMSAQQYALSFACTALGIIGGSFVSGRLGRRGVGEHVPLSIGLGGAVVFSALLVAMALAHRGGLLPFLGALVACTFCYGLVAPNAAHGAMHPHPDIAGVAGAALGFTQMACGSLASAAVAGLAAGAGVLAMTGTMLVCAVAAGIGGLSLRTARA